MLRHLIRGVHGEIRLVYMLGPEFDDYYEGGRLGGSEARRARQPASFERMAIVTDARWTAPALEIFSVLWPGQARAFPLSELEAAKRWAAADSS